ncbi:MAG TPA: M23 family metallopeptidase [Kiritimatiellia bacterium]|nr:M23 family metallopeptidase [Kiritimatiellia bacterium]
MFPAPPSTTSFRPLEGLPIPTLCWPTLRRDLFNSPTSYFARTSANPQYGMPGWTRDCGRRFHRGCDIAPLRALPTGNLIRILFSDCSTGAEYPADEPEWIPDDEIFAIASGRIAVAESDPEKSNLGRYLILDHSSHGFPCFTLYAHLDTLSVTTGQHVAGGARLGSMGRTARSEDARRWMAIAPHLHFEVWTPDGQSCHPIEVLRKGLTP